MDLLDRPGAQASVSCDDPDPVAVHLDCCCDSLTAGVGDKAAIERVHTIRSLVPYPKERS
jgi:hypothetical protein